ncbi:hypothetical protein TNIN_307141 [Trichonephila inaurata madagascariensis]|uniref:Uncharacterized protein n=1 Tax=Trichonephila inaurata madagascariensis TaxID=2747483 RepID=A0A8X7C946_9ARAC|nr:hypothetical protein TNIN_307141 [Trichonephila inaurata madagascariensis]
MKYIFVCILVLALITVACEAGNSMELDQKMSNDQEDRAEFNSVEADELETRAPRSAMHWGEFPMEPFESYTTNELTLILNSEI